MDDSAMPWDPARVSDRLSRELATVTDLPANTRAWFVAHRISPRLLAIALDPEGTRWEDVWLITDHTGTEDSPFRLYFDERKDRFGRECLLENGIACRLGTDPS